MNEKIPVIAVLDVGKTNKKAFLFDENYRIVYERSSQLKETVDDDGFPCEDVLLLRDWVNVTLAEMMAFREFKVKALNVSAYGASFVHLDAPGEVLKPLYNYLKPYPADLSHSLHEKYGGTGQISLRTASPSLGHLNSGLQLFWLSKLRNNYFTQVHLSLHLPQFIAWVVTGQSWSDMTSIGCHTLLWDFAAKKYHPWVTEEGIFPKLAPIASSDTVSTVRKENKDLIVGVGLHDSSAALIPYLAQFPEPFLLLSTGTWNISLNPFSQSPLTAEELRNDCLCYLDYKGNPVKASRLFAGNAHDVQTARLVDHYHVDQSVFTAMRFNPDITNLEQVDYRKPDSAFANGGTGIYQSRFAKRDLAAIPGYEEAYHQLILDIVGDQVAATRQIMDINDRTTRIFVDGGFGQNGIFMSLLAAAFPEKEVFAASLHQASALGAALAIHDSWNKRTVPKDLIGLTLFR